MRVGCHRCHTGCDILIRSDDAAVRNRYRVRGHGLGLAGNVGKRLIRERGRRTRVEVVRIEDVQAVYVDDVTVCARHYADGGVQHRGVVCERDGLLAHKERVRAQRAGA